MKNLGERYTAIYQGCLTETATALQRHLEEIFEYVPHVDRISARAKSPESFMKKAGKLVADRPKYESPFTQIQDQIGVRIVVFYKTDVEEVDRRIHKYFRPIEFKNRIPESEWEFGYFGRHYVLLLPSDLKLGIQTRDSPQFFELQIKTLFQHAWSEAGHDLAYKPGMRELTADQKRRLAFTSAQAWGADRVFDELFTELSAKD